MLFAAQLWANKEGLKTAGQGLWDEHVKYFWMCNVTASEWTRDTQTNPHTDIPPTETDDPRLEVFWNPSIDVKRCNRNEILA